MLEKHAEKFGGILTEARVIWDNGRLDELCECSGLMPENVLGANGRCIKCGADLT